MHISDFDYDLPEELIAQKPIPGRSGSRMLTVNHSNPLNHFYNFPNFIEPGDCLVINNTKVIPARLYGTKQGGSARIEMLLIEELSVNIWEVMLRPGKRCKPGTIVELEGANATYTVLETLDGTYKVQFNDDDAMSIIEALGAMPLPPYIERSADQDDLDQYQTVYAENAGAVAAPTAGLHFTEEILQKLKDKGVNIAELTLHVGIGTFQPVMVDRIEEHKMHEERYHLSKETADLINQTKANGKRVIAIGTTSVRVLESCCDENGFLNAQEGRTDIFLYPPYKPKVCDALLTNFHLPKSTLLMLVSCFCGLEKLKSSYELAINEKFRFYSYGDCMLVENT